MGSKGGFFNLFDWNSKSRKKLFANEGLKQGKKSDDALSTTPYSTVDEDEIIRRKGGSDHSCASSSVDDEGIGARAPSVVARLMGLESLPTTSVSDPYSSPSYESHTVRQVNYQKRILDPQINGFGVPSKFDGFSRQPIETRQQKMPSSPIDRFRTEALPPKSAKSLPITHHKLLSPIKNPNGFTTSKNAAHIMEAAAKIIEPGLHGFGPKSGTRLLGSSSIPLKVRDPKESSVPQRAPRLVEAQCRQVESAAARSLRGQALNRSWNGSDDSGDFGTSPDSGIRSSNGVKSKGKSVSLAVQAKVNVQRREATSSSGRSFSVQKDQEESKPNPPPKSQVNAQKNNRQKKTSVPVASSVLRQNNQKQNCSSNREKLSSKATGSSQHGKKVVSGDVSCGRSKTSSRVSGNLKVGLRKDASDMADEKEGFSSRTKNVPRKKRLIDGEFQTERSGINVWVDGREKNVQSNIVIDEHIKWEEDIGKKGTDVVSFTFTSPMGKSAQTPRPVVVLSEKLDPKNGCHVDALSEKKTADLKNKKASSHELNVMGGDALSILLDRKLRELACGVDLSYCNLVKMGSANTTASFILDTGSTSDSIGILQEKHEKNNLPVSHEENSDGASDSVCSSTNGLVLKVKNKPWESQGTMDFSITSDARKDVDPQNPSPLSILEASFSNESCNSSESCDSTNGSNNLSSIQSHNFVVRKEPSRI
ncbi:hypothetical protein QJS10_CPA05g00281 [Acorus calamus]|uniref:DUF3741 domain-containing protein n=1 Tax=Acorus calamus TaxID=4465 RepID=A0AAV9EW40_ACOCL|nr:hypothetical protein QJS10_CPA05g00281 [Acorus calamus]